MKFFFRVFRNNYLLKCYVTWNNEMYKIFAQSDNINTCRIEPKVCTYNYICMCAATNDKFRLVYLCYCFHHCTQFTLFIRTITRAHICRYTKFCFLPPNRYRRRFCFVSSERSIILLNSSV